MKFSPYNWNYGKNNNSLLTGQKSIKVEFIEIGTKFLRELGEKGIRVSAIVGSTSYEPSPEDDIDIFLITKKDLLWFVFLKSLIVRKLYRYDRICLSLFMDEHFSVDYFQRLDDKLIISDAKHAIVIFGQNFYESLLEKINNRETEPKVPTNKIKNEKFKISHIKNLLLNLISMIVVLPPVLIKGMIASKKLEKSKGDFKIVYGWRKFYFDSRKYGELRKKVNGTENEL